MKSPALHEWLADCCNKANEIALAEQELKATDEILRWAGQDYISAEEAWKLGAGCAEYRHRDPRDNRSKFSGWNTCYSSFEKSSHVFEVQYRAIKPQAQPEPMDLELARAMCRGAGISLVSRDFIERFADFVSDWKKGDFTLPKYAEIDMQSCFDAWQAFDPDLANAQPEPVEPTCQVQHINGFTSGEVITMTREAAQTLQRELGDTVEWESPQGLKTSEPLHKLWFDAEGIYTYKTKATIKLDGKMVTREQAMAEWESKKETCDAYCWTDSCPSWDKNPDACGGDFIGIEEVNGIEYQLRAKPAKVVLWEGSRDDVIALLKELELLK